VAAGGAGQHKGEEALGRHTLVQVGKGTAGPRFRAVRGGQLCGASVRNPNPKSRLGIRTELKGEREKIAPVSTKIGSLNPQRKKKVSIFF